MPEKSQEKTTDERESTLQKIKRKAPDVILSEWKAKENIKYNKAIGMAGSEENWSNLTEGEQRNIIKAVRSPSPNSLKNNSSIKNKQQNSSTHFKKGPQSSRAPSLSPQKKHQSEKPQSLAERSLSLKNEEKYLEKMTGENFNPSRLLGNYKEQLNVKKEQKALEISKRNQNLEHNPQYTTRAHLWINGEYHGAFNSNSGVHAEENVKNYIYENPIKNTEKILIVIDKSPCSKCQKVLMELKDHLKEHYGASLRVSPKSIYQGNTDTENTRKENLNWLISNRSFIRSLSEAKDNYKYAEDKIEPLIKYRKMKIDGKGNGINRYTLNGKKK